MLRIACPIPRESVASPVTRDDIVAARARIAADVRRTPLLRLKAAPRRRLRGALAQARAPAARRQLQGARHVQPDARRSRSRRPASSSRRAATPASRSLARRRRSACAARSSCPRSAARPSAPSWRSSAPHVTVGGSGYAEALQASLQRQQQSGALLMHAYDQPEVVAGAGTLAAEVEDEAGLPDRALVSVGGGGLIAGIAAWFENRCRVEALEPVLAPTLHRAFAAGRPVDVDVAGIAADSLGAGASARSPGASRSSTSQPRTSSTTRPSARRSSRSGPSFASRSSRPRARPRRAHQPHRRARARREGAAGDLRREPEPGQPRTVSARHSTPHAGACRCDEPVAVADGALH
jgi:threonine dehydratase